MVSTKKLIKFRECTKKQKENRIVYLIISMSAYFILMFLIGFKYSIPAVNTITAFMLKAVKFVQPYDPISFIFYYGLMMAFGAVMPLIITAAYFPRYFDKLFFRTKIDIGLKNEI